MTLVIIFEQNFPFLIHFKSENIENQLKSLSIDFLSNPSAFYTFGTHSLKNLSVMTNTLTANQIFEKLSFGSCEADCLFMYILTQNYFLN